MPKTAKTPSWRTLMRRAKDEENAGKPKVAAALRAEAATLRGPRSKPKAKRAPKKPGVTKPRSEIMKKAWATRRLNMNKNEMNPVPNMAEVQASMRADEAANSNDRTAYQAVERPGHGQIVGGAEHQFAEEMAKMIRRKGGKDDFQNAITAKIAQARGEGEQLGRITANKLAIARQQKMDQHIVCGFIAEVEDAMQKLGGLPRNQIWTVNSLLIVKITDALNAAGYTSRGMRDESPTIVRPRT